MRAFIIYNSFSLACKANTLLQRAGANISDAFQWKVIPWRTEMLRSGIGGQLALKEARDANLLVFAWHDTTPFSTAIERWLENWAATRNVSEPAIALVNEGGNVFDMDAARGISRFAETHGLGVILSRGRIPEFCISGPVLVGELAQERPVLEADLG